MATRNEGWTNRKEGDKHMPTLQQYEALLSLAERAIHATQVERYVRELKRDYPFAFKLSQHFYCAVYRAACDSAIINVNKLYNANGKSLTLYTIMQNVTNNTPQPQRDCTRQLQGFIKQHHTEIDAIRKLRNECVAHLSRQQSTITVDKSFVEVMAETAYQYIATMCKLQCGHVYRECTPCNDIEMSARIIEKLQDRSKCEDG